MFSGTLESNLQHTLDRKNIDEWRLPRVDTHVAASLLLKRSTIALAAEIASAWLQRGKANVTKITAVIST